MKSPTLSEELAEKYCLPCGAQTSQGPMIFHSLAIARKFRREDLQPLNKAIRVLSRSIFGADAFELPDGTRAEKICPAIGGTGWKRYPGADHWLVTRNGSPVFRTQNYSFLLRYFCRKAGIA